MNTISLLVTKVDFTECCSEEVSLMVGVNYNNCTMYGGSEI